MAEFPEFGGGNQNWGDVNLAGNQGVGYSSPNHRPRPPPEDSVGARSGNKNAAWMQKGFDNADPQTMVFIIAACSFVVMAQAGVECNGKWTESCENEYVYAIVVGVLSFIVSLIVIAWSFCAEALFTQFSPIIAFFFVAWWGFGTFVITNKDPFSNSGNGYFASWAALITAFLMAGNASKTLQRFMGSACSRVVADSIESRLAMGIMASSVVLLIAVAFEASDYENPSNQEIWGVICAVISFMFVLCHTLLRMCCENMTCPPTPFGVALSAWWLGAVAVLTFDEPFKTSGNGYFACWMGFIFSVWLALEGWDGYGGMGWGNRKQQLKNDEAAAGMGMNLPQ